MAAMIKPDAVIRLFENNLFDFSTENGKNYFTYESGKFSMKFTADWFSNDSTSEYDLAQVRSMMKKMMDGAKAEEDIYAYKKDSAKLQKLVDAMKDYGMIYDPDDEMYHYVVDGSAVFSLELDYLVALIVRSPSMSVKELLDAMKESAEHDAKMKK